MTEVGSNFSLSGQDCWGPRDENRLGSLGWGEPDPPRRTNWIRLEYTTNPPVDEVAKLAADTLAEVFGLGGEDEVFVKMFGSPIHGNTPACPKYQAGADDLGEGDVAEDDLPDDEEDEVSDAFEESGERIDARICPTCWMRGILPVAQPSTPDGRIEGPVMVCPRCDVEFHATGLTLLGAFWPV